MFPEAHRAKIAYLAVFLLGNRRAGLYNDIGLLLPVFGLESMYGIRNFFKFLRRISGSEVIVRLHEVK
jgi:hypothetical protein